MLTGRNKISRSEAYSRLGRVLRNLKHIDQVDQYLKTNGRLSICHRNNVHEQVTTYDKTTGAYSVRRYPVQNGPLKMSCMKSDILQALIGSRLIQVEVELAKLIGTLK